MSAATHCDRANCDTWSTSSEAARHGFLRVVWDGRPFDFCSVDHMLQFFAHIPPMEEVR